MFGMRGTLGACSLKPFAVVLIFFSFLQIGSSKPENCHRDGQRVVSDERQSVTS